MITCPVCGTQNDTLAGTCIHCRGYLQGKVDALNLFETAWGLVESPRSAFRRIVLARHKNYAVILSGLFGIALVYGIAWARHAGNVIADPVVLGAIGPVLGPLVGIGAVAMFAVALKILGHMLGGRGSFRNLRAMAAYATVPIICSLVFVFPVEIVVFGFAIFGTNPHPMVINPAAYIVLVGLDGLAVAWSWGLLVEGIAVASSLTRLRAALLAGILLILTAAVLMAAVLL